MMRNTGGIEKVPGFLICIPWRLDLVGGVNEVVKNLYDRLAGSGHVRPIVLVINWDDKTLRTVQEEGREVVYLRLPSPYATGAGFISFLANLPFVMRQLFRVFSRYSVQYVNIHFPSPSCACFWLFRKISFRKFGIVVSFHGSDYEGIVRDHSPWTKGVRSLLKTARAVTAPSQSLAKKLRNELSLGNVDVIYNGVEAKGLHAAPSHSSKLLEKVEFAPYILQVGAFEHVKGHDLIVRAFARVRRNGSACKLLIVGRRGTTYDQVASLVADTGLEGAVVLSDGVSREEIGLLMRGAECVTLTSRSEGGIPLVLLEAGELGKAVVALSVGGVAELVKHRETGLVPDDDNPDAIAKEIVRALRDERLRKRLGDALHQAVQSKFTWDQTAREYLKASGWEARYESNAS